MLTPYLENGASESRIREAGEFAVKMLNALERAQVEAARND